MKYKLTKPPGSFAALHELEQILKREAEQKKIALEAKKTPATCKPITEQSVSQLSINENSYPCRIGKIKITLRLPEQKVKQYKIWCLLNNVSLQDAVEQAMDNLLASQANTKKQS